MPLELIQLLEKNNNRNSLLKKLFREEINGPFLIGIKGRVLDNLGEDVLKLYDFVFSEEKIWTGADNTVDYEICKMIIGVHNANNLFVSPEDIAEREQDTKYKEQLASQVAEQVRLRRYAGMKFRQKPLLSGERFIYYPVPYLLFALCMRMFELIDKNKLNDAAANRILLIAYRSMASLTLLEDGFLDVAYTPCRTVVEDFLRLEMCLKEPALFEKIEMFQSFEIDQSNCYQEYPAEFNTLYEERKNKCKCAKADYLHYGFVDFVDDYHDLVDKSRSYSLYGIFEYLRYSADNETCAMLERLSILYKMCHGYIHGAVNQAKYPQLHYLEISLILGEIVLNVYISLCEENGIGPSIDGIDVIGRFKNEYALLQAQYDKRSTETFELERIKSKRYLQ